MKVFLEVEDAVDMRELLGFLTDWLAADDSVGVAWESLVGGRCSVEELLGDLTRLAVLLGIEELAIGGGR